MNGISRIRIKNKTISILFFIFFCAALFLTLTLPGRATATPAAPSVALIQSGLRDNTAFANWLVSLGYTGGVDTITYSNVTNTDLSSFDLIIIDSDTASTTSWDWIGGTDAACYIAGFGKPILGLGEGGTFFFQELVTNQCLSGFNPYLGYGSYSYYVVPAYVNLSASIYQSSPVFNGLTSPITVYNSSYTDDFNHYNSSFGPPPPNKVMCIQDAYLVTLTPPNGGLTLLLDIPGTYGGSPENDFTLIQAGNYVEWGAAQAFGSMTTDGKTLFANVCNYLMGLNTYWLDQDGDGFGNPNYPIGSVSPTPPPGYAANNLDCNDSDATVHPGAPNVCGKDNGCNGTWSGGTYTPAPYNGPECVVTGGSTVTPTSSVAPGASMFVTATFNADPPIQTIRPDCFNTVFTLMDANGRVPAYVCNIPPGYGIPNDVVSIPSGPFTLTCNVAEWYRPEALAPGTYTVFATFQNGLQDPDWDSSSGTCANPPCYPLWTGAVSSDPATVTISSSPQVNVLTGTLSFTTSDGKGPSWNMGWGSTDPSTQIIATLQVPSTLPTGDQGNTIASVTLNGIPALSISPLAAGVSGGAQIIAYFDSQLAVQSLGTVVVGPTVYPTVEATLSSGDIVRAKTKVTIYGITATTSVSSSSNPSTYGQQVTFTATVSSASGTPTGTVTFSDGSNNLGTVTLAGGQATFATTSSLSPGSHSIIAAYSGDSNYAPSTASLSQQVNTATPVTPTITWSNPSAITYGTALSGAQLNAAASFGETSVPGTFAYSPAAGTVLNAGAGQTLNVTFTPTDTTDYSTATGSVTIAVSQATATVTLSNMTQTYTGSPLTPTATTSPSGLGITWTGAPQASAGTYSVTATVNNANYKGSASGAFTISQATATVTLSNMTQTYTGSPLTPTATTSPSGLGITWTGAPQTKAGTYSVTATVNNASYTGSASGAFTINKAKPTITWSNPSAITYGTALSSTQLNAKVSVPGTFAYSPAAGTVLNAGAGQTLNVTFTPTDTTDYSTATASVSINVIYSLTMGHVILPPINPNGTSVFSKGIPVPARFQVFNAQGKSIGTQGVVSSFNLIEIKTSAGVQIVDEAVKSAVPGVTAFIWDPILQEWDFLISTANYKKKATYFFQISLKDGSLIMFDFGQD